ncbi:MAG: hypothetical protein V1647_03095 [Pseudomonadota bacterium]
MDKIAGLILFWFLPLFIVGSLQAGVYYNKKGITIIGVNLKYDYKSSRTAEVGLIQFENFVCSNPVPVINECIFNFKTEIEYIPREAFGQWTSHYTCSTKANITRANKDPYKKNGIIIKNVKCSSEETIRTKSNTSERTGVSKTADLYLEFGKNRKQKIFISSYTVKWGNEDDMDMGFISDDSDSDTVLEYKKYDDYH